MPPVEYHDPIEALITESQTALIERGTSGASQQDIMLAGFGWLGGIIRNANGRNPHPRTPREIALVGLEKGGPWAMTATLLGYFLSQLIGG